MISISLNSTARYKTCVTKNILYLSNLNILICNKGVDLHVFPQNRDYLKSNLVVGYEPDRVIVHKHKHKHRRAHDIQINSSFVCLVLYRLLALFNKRTSTVSPVQKSRNAIWWPLECTRDSLAIKNFQGEHAPGPP